MLLRVDSKRFVWSFALFCCVAVSTWLTNFTGATDFVLITFPIVCSAIIPLINLFNFRIGRVLVAFPLILFGVGAFWLSFILSLRIMGNSMAPSYFVGGGAAALIHYLYGHSVKNFDLAWSSLFFSFLCGFLVVPVADLLTDASDVKPMLVNIFTIWSVLVGLSWSISQTKENGR